MAENTATTQPRSVLNEVGLSEQEIAKRKAFLKAFTVLQRRISLFANLRLDQLDRLALQTQLRDIGTR